MLTGQLSYSGQLQLQPQNEALQAQITLKYPVTENTSVIELILHRDMKIESVKGPKLKRYDFDPNDCSYRYATHGGTLRLSFEKTLQKNEEVILTFRYSAQQLGVTSEWLVNRLTAEWVELGLYTPWFPFDPSSRAIAYDLQITAPPDYEVTGLGLVTRKNGLWQMVSDGPKSDVVIIAAPKLHKLQAGTDPRIQVEYINPQDESLARFCIREGNWLLQFYSNWLDMPNTMEQMSVVITPRKQGGGYARRGLIVIATPKSFEENKKGYFYGIAHEAAHLWWMMAETSTWQDWLNEGFAEYCSMIALREKFGLEYFHSVMDKKRDKVVQLPPIWGIDRNHNQAYDVLYHKACILLHDLAAEIGEDQFTHLLRRMLSEQVKTTLHFLTLLCDIAGEAVSTKFEQHLKQ